MTDFQAVDLDAVLDQFEFHEEEEEVLKNLKSSTTTTSSSTTTTATTSTIPEPNVVDSFTDISTMTKAEVAEEVMKPKCTEKNELILDQTQTSAVEDLGLSELKILGGPCGTEIENIYHESGHQETDDGLLVATAPLSGEELDFGCSDICVRLNASQPDVLSGCIENMSDSLVEHLENWSEQDLPPAASQTEQQKQQEETQSAGSSESNPSSGHAFESIYDKYSTKSSDQEEGDVMEDKSVEESRKNPIESLLAFRPEELTDEELNQLLDQLEAGEELELKKETNSETSVPREMGARPKQVRREVHSASASASASHETEEAGSSTAAHVALVERPDIVLTTPVIPDSPPPYSEIDPASEQNESTKTLIRPTSLELGASSENPDDGTGIENVIPEECSSTREEEDTSNAVLGPPGSTPANPNGPNNVQIPALLQGLSEDQLILGKVSPFWVPDSEAPVCMICDMKFTLVKRRHHCRACGKVLCSLCCSEKFPLPYLEDKEARVCKPCRSILERLLKAESMSASRGQPPAPPSGPGNRPNPSNPMEYCSTVSPMLQVTQTEATPLPPVMVPVSVLKRFDTTPSGDPKQVMFSDGIRPGGDLTELDEEDHHHTPRRSGSHRSSSSKRRSSRGQPAGATDVARSMIPPDRLPYVSNRGPVDELELMKIFAEGSSPVPFTLNRNLRVYVSSVLYTPISNKVWNFRTQGLTSVGQDEVVILLVQLPDEPLPPREIFEHLQTLYEASGAGTQVGDMGHTVILSGKPFLGGTQYGGFLYFRHTFQCIDGLDLPTAPFLFAVLLTKWEMPWARVFPLRLLLRLGAEARYYPAPLWSTRQRQTVFKEIGNTIMKLLSDFRNFTYSLPIIRAMVIHMEDKLTTIIIPKNSYSQIQRALQNSNDPVLALGANFSSTADSHLVAVQREEDEPPRNPMNNSDYETQAINILNKPRKVTGASFVVLNGALKSSSGLTAKSSIVEDGIMVQVSQERMLQIRKSLNNMEDCRIDCGPQGSDRPDETVYIKWIENDQSVNAGIKSIIDGSPMDGIMSIRIKGSPQDHISGEHCIRWTELFILPTSRLNTSYSEQQQADFADPPDPARVASHVAKAVCVALLPHLAKLKEEDLTPLAVRVCLDPENAGYEAGSHHSSLPQEFMNSLDNQLVPVVHGQSGSRAAFELIFHVLDVC